MKVKIKVVLQNPGGLADDEYYLDEKDIVQAMIEKANRLEFSTAGEYKSGSVQGVIVTANNNHKWSCRDV